MTKQILRCYFAIFSIISSVYSSTEFGENSKENGTEFAAEKLYEFKSLAELDMLSSNFQKKLQDEKSEYKIYKKGTESDELGFTVEELYGHQRLNLSKSSIYFLCQYISKRNWLKIWRAAYN